MGEGWGEGAVDPPVVLSPQNNPHPPAHPEPVEGPPLP